MRWGPTEVGWAHNPVSLLSLKETQTETHRRRWCDDGDRDWRTTNQGMIRIAANHQKLARDKERSFPIGSEGACTCWHLDFRHVASRIMRQYFCSFKSPSLWLFVMEANIDTNNVSWNCWRHSKYISKKHRLRFLHGLGLYS